MIIIFQEVNFKRIRKEKESISKSIGWTAFGKEEVRRSNWQIKLLLKNRANIITLLLSFCVHLLCNRKSTVDTGRIEKGPSWKAQILCFLLWPSHFSFDRFVFSVFSIVSSLFCLRFDFVKRMHSAHNVYRHLKTIYDVCFLSISLVIDNFKMRPRK